MDLFQLIKIWGQFLDYFTSKFEIFEFLKRNIEFAELTHIDIIYGLLSDTVAEIYPLLVLNRKMVSLFRI